MIRCTKCHGVGGYKIGEKEVTCTQCGGLGAVNDPQVDLLVMALEQVAVELMNLRYIAERWEHGRGYPN